MHPNNTMSRQIQARRALLRLALVVFPVASIAHPNKSAHIFLSTPPPGLLPYLKSTAPPPLRFQDPEPPPDLARSMPLDRPPEPINVVPPMEVDHPPVEPAEPMELESLDESVNTPATAPAESSSTPAPILADEARIPVRIEDFLPYFAVPGQAAEPPRPDKPATQPPSSATYRQQ